eukprot:bmy_18972T0
MARLVPLPLPKTHASCRVRPALGPVPAECSGGNCWGFLFRGSDQVWCPVFDFVTATWLMVVLVALSRSSLALLVGAPEASETLGLFLQGTLEDITGVRNSGGSLPLETVEISGSSFPESDAVTNFEDFWFSTVSSEMLIAQANVISSDWINLTTDTFAQL